MTKEQLLALKPGPTVKNNSQYPVPTVSVEARRVILTHHDLQKRDVDYVLSEVSPLVIDSETYKDDKTLTRKKNKNNGLNK